MLNAIITANEQTAVVEFPIDRYELQRQLNQIGLRCDARRIRLTDNEDDDIQVKLYADNDFGNHVIQLFNERDTLDDVHTAVGAITIAPDEVKEGLEEYILHDQLAGTGHLYRTIQELKESIAPVVTTFYCPLTAKILDGFDTFVQERLHNMAQSTKPGEMFEELLIGNFNLLEQAERNNKYLLEQTRQLTLFDYQYDY